MRFLRLDLLAYGPFTGRSIDLEGGADGLHLIYGPNETGKTSALAAISDLLFGFGHRTTADFVHPTSQLRVGALLRRSSGETIEIVRRKARTGTLLNPRTNQSWPDDALAPYVGGLSRNEFEQQFGLTHATLRDQGGAPRAGVGLFGEILFAAAAGLPDLRRSEQELTKRLANLFVPRGSSQKIAVSLHEIESARADLESRQLSTDTWTRQRQEVEEASRASAETEARRQEARAAHDRLDRRSRALPLCRERKQLLEALELHAQTPRLEPEAGKQRIEAQARERQAREVIREAETLLPSLRDELAKLPDVSGLLELAPQIEKLNVELGAYKKARDDCAKRAIQCQSDEHEAREILRDLRRDPDDLDPERHRVSESDAETLRKLAEDRGSRQLAVDEPRALMREHNEARRRARQTLAKLPRPDDIKGLRDRLDQARGLGDIDRQIASLDSRLAAADRALRKALKALPAFEGTVEALEAQVVPVDETISRLAQAWTRMQESQQESDRQTRSLKSALRQVLAELKALEAAGDVPDPRDLAAARQARDERFDRLVDKLRHEPAATERGAYQDAVKTADDLADRIWREADRVARKLQKDSDRERLEAELVAIDAQCVEILRERGVIDTEWRDLRTRLQVALDSPAELAGWLRARATVLEKAEQKLAAQAEHDALMRERDVHRASLTEACAALSQPLTDPNSTLAEILQHADRLVAAAETLRRKRLKLREQASQAREDFARARRKAKEAALELSRWKQAWTSAVATIDLQPEATTDQVRHTLTRLQELHVKFKTIRDFQRRIATMERDARQFEAEVRSLAERVGVDSTRAVDVVVADLNARVVVARNQRNRLETLDQSILKEERRLKAAEAQLDGALGALRSLCRAGGCDDPERLPEIETKATERDKLEARLDSCEEALRTHASGADVVAFTAEVLALDADQLESDLAQARQRMEQLDEEVKAAIGRAVTARNGWESHSGGDGAAVASERMQQAQARLVEEVAEFTRLKLAQAVLRRAIDRYRERSQGPVMELADRYFRLLTCGSFVRLDLDEMGGVLSLEGRRADDSAVHFDAMSDGTRDQLYLALRLAALQQWLESHEPVPLVVDDILLTFDDQRAAAALEALAELSRFTQVLLFTHHEHLVDLAERTLSPTLLFLQRLPAREEQKAG